MKRKRGHKKYKSKGARAVSANEASVDPISQNTEYNDEQESAMAIDTPSSTGTDQPNNLSIMKTVVSGDKTTGKSVGRVKVKLKTTKTLESQFTSSDAYTHSDTDKSSLQLGVERQSTVIEKMEDSANSMPEMRSNLGNPTIKTGSIKIKSSKILGSSTIQQNRNVQLAQGKNPEPKETRMPPRNFRYNKQELDSSLTVIKKVMKMDAAEPFNVPVDPVALGIPDYFDVIDTPMDFGTICQNLEAEGKYMNSEDVFNDVQYIWENCYKYNNKGDYILDLMRRVKKNFMKYWLAAGLYNAQSRGSHDSENIQMNNAEASNLGKANEKCGQSKQTTRKRHGFRRHKNDCLCAICVLKRRRREREENERIARGNTSVGDHNPTQEETSFGESPCGEDISSDTADSIDKNVECDVGENKQDNKLNVSKQKHGLPEEDDDEENVDEDEDEMETQKNGESPDQSKFVDNKPVGEPKKQIETRLVERSVVRYQTDTQNADILSQPTEETTAIQQQKRKELKERRQKDTKNKNLHYENPTLIGLCEVLFPPNRKCVWSGPHSLVQHQGSARVSSIHEAIQTIMK